MSYGKDAVNWVSGIIPEGTGEFVGDSLKASADIAAKIGKGAVKGTKQLGEEVIDFGTNLVGDGTNFASEDDAMDKWLKTDHIKSTADDTELGQAAQKYGEMGGEFIGVGGPIVKGIAKSYKLYKGLNKGTDLAKGLIRSAKASNDKITKLEKLQIDMLSKGKDTAKIDKAIEKEITMLKKHEGDLNKMVEDGIVQDKRVQQIGVLKQKQDALKKALKNKKLSPEQRAGLKLQLEKTKRLIKDGPKQIEKNPMQAKNVTKGKGKADDIKDRYSKYKTGAKIVGGSTALAGGVAMLGSDKDTESKDNVIEDKPKGNQNSDSKPTDSKGKEKNSHMVGRDDSIGSMEVGDKEVKLYFDKTNGKVFAKGKGTETIDFMSGIDIDQAKDLIDRGEFSDWSKQYTNYFNPRATVYQGGGIRN